LWSSVLNHLNLAIFRWGRECEMEKMRDLC